MKKAFKRILSSFLVAALILTSAPLSGFVGLEFPEWLSFAKIGEYIKAAAANETFQEGIYVYSKENDEITIKGLDKKINRKEYSGSLDIPETIDGKRVTKIGECAFKDFIGITSVYLPDSLKEIQGGAFFNCTSLSLVSMSPNVEIIGGLAFGKCTSLKSVILPSTLKDLGGGAFFKTSITSISIPASLQTSHIGYGVVGIGLGYRIGPFSSSKLKNIYFEKGCKKIGEGLFFGCTELEEVNIPDSIEVIENAAFYKCSNLKKVTGMTNVKEIKQVVFCYCESLTDIKLPKGLTAIGGGAFAVTTNLKHIVIPNTLTEAGTSMGVVGIGLQNDLCPFKSSGLLHIEFEEGIKKIPAAICRDARNLAVIELPESVEIIESLAFSKCVILPEVTLPSKLKTLEAGAFLNDKNLKKINIPKSLMKSSRAASVIGIGSGAAGPLDGTQIKEITLEDGMEKIPSALFYGCETLEKIELPESINKIEDYAFFGCKSLGFLHIPDSVSRIDQKAFANCSEDFYICSESLDSYAKKYADNNDVKFKICGNTQEFETYYMYLLSSNSDLYVGEKQILNVSFELIGRDKDMRTAIIADSAFAISSSDNGIVSIESIVKNDGTTKAKLFGERPGTSVLTVTAYREDEYIDNKSYLVTVKGEQVYSVDSIPEEDDFNVYTRGLTVDNYKYYANENSYSVSFDVYNEAACFGSVEVYDKDGNLLQCLPISKRDGKLPTGIWDSMQKAFDMSYLNDISYKNEAYSKKTVVEIDYMPRDGHIVITNSIDSSLPCLLYNVTYLSVEVLLTAIETYVAANRRDALIESVSEEVVQELMKALAGQKNDVINTILKEFIVNTKIEDTERCKNTVVKFIKCCGSIDIDIPGILMNIIHKKFKEIPIGLAETAVLTLMGSAGQLFKTAFKLFGLANTTNMICDMSRLSSDNSINIYGRSLQNSVRYSNGYSVSSDAGFDGGVSFHQYKIVDTSKIDAVKMAFSDIRKVQVFGMSLYQNGEEVQLKGSADVAIPVPKGMDIFSLRLYRQEPDGTYTEMKYNVVNGYIYFTTEHFSVYCFTSDPKTPQELTFESDSVAMIVNDLFFQMPISNPTDISDDVNLIWSSSDENVAEVTDDGLVISKNIGEAVITVSTEDGSVTASYNVTVKNAAKVNGVSVGDITLNYKKSTTLNPTITADEGAEYTVKYSSSNPSVARVDENGKVYAAKKGSATITCTVIDSNGNTVTDTCNVNVKYSFGQWLIIIVLFGWIWY